MELKTNAFRARFAPEANNFVSLVNLATGDDYIKAAPRGPLVELYALAERCAACLRVNTGVKHLFGLLAVDSMPAAETEDNQLDRSNKR